jgi:hypothetical protein
LRESKGFRQAQALTSMAGAAAAATASGTRGSGGGADTAARNAFISTALEAANGHDTLNITTLALRAVYRLVTSKNQSLELLIALTAFKLINRHLETSD